VDLLPAMAVVIPATADISGLGFSTREEEEE
jgi:hypothetical protein